MNEQEILGIVIIDNRELWAKAFDCEFGEYAEKTIEKCVEIYREEIQKQLRGTFIPLDTDFEIPFDTERNPPYDKYSNWNKFGRKDTFLYSVYEKMVPEILDVETSAFIMAKGYFRMKLSDCIKWLNKWDHNKERGLDIFKSYLYMFNLNAEEFKIEDLENRYQGEYEDCEEFASWLNGELGYEEDSEEYLDSDYLFNSCGQYMITDEGYVFSDN